jgi:phosphatidate cytidylyltransferase
VAAEAPGGPGPRRREAAHPRQDQPQPDQPQPDQPQPDQPDQPQARRAGRNLPAAVAVGLGLGGLAILTLFTVKATFIVYMGAVVGIALWELGRALGSRGIRLPLVPVAAGGAAALALAFAYGERPLVASLGITVVAILAWRLPGGTAGYLRDVTAGMFALVYLPLMAAFVGLLLAPPDGPRRTVVFLILAVCSDIGGYAAGVLFGRHLMAPVISPKKTWEGLAGSLVACVAAGGIALPLLLHGPYWQGMLIGLAALAAATLGDLSESMIKRDLAIKDMGSVLPGHGGVLDRIDSLLVTAPVSWLLLTVFLPPR